MTLYKLFLPLLFTAPWVSPRVAAATPASLGPTAPQPLSVEVPEAAVIPAIRIETGWEVRNDAPFGDATFVPEPLSLLITASAAMGLAALNGRRRESE